MNPVLVTVAIALYNNEKYVERCLKSVLAQTYPHLEAIVVDDGSTDNSAARCNLFLSDSRVKIIKKENGGLSSARQMALDNANGEYICFIDADDYLSEFYVERLLKKIERDNADISVCSTRFESEKGERLGAQSGSFACKDSAAPLRMTIDYLQEDNFPLNVTITDSWNKLYKISFLKQCEACFSMPRGLNGSDTAFNMKLALNEPIYSTLSDELYYHVIYQQSAAHRKKKDLYNSFCIIVQQLHAETKRNGRVEIAENYISMVYCSCLRHAMQDVFDEIESRKEKKRSINEILNKHQIFISENNYIKLNWRQQNRQSSKLFVFILQVFPSALNTYFSIRGKAIKLLS